jgi:hypothetical protein
MMQKRRLGNAVLITVGLLLLWFGGAAAEEQETVTLACEGSVASGSGEKDWSELPDRSPVSESIILHFKDGVQECSCPYGIVKQSFIPYIVGIVVVTDTKVSLDGSWWSPPKGTRSRISDHFHGTIDRVTGRAEFERVQMKHHIGGSTHCNAGQPSACSSGEIR